MKPFKLFLLVMAGAFVITLALLTVDRQSALMYAAEGTVSGRLQLFIENLLDYIKIYIRKVCF